MQDTLNFPTTSTTTRQPLSPPSKLNFPSKHPSFPSFSHPKPPSKFPSLSSKTTTILPLYPPNSQPFPSTTTTTTTKHLPLKPSKTQPFPSTTTTTTTTTKHLPLKPTKTQPFPSTTTTTTTTTKHHPLKPSKTQPLPPTTKHHPLKPSKTHLLPTTTTKHHPKKHPTTTTTTTPTPHFKEKLLFLDSLGLDSLTLLPPSAIAATPSLSDLKSLIDYLTSLNFTPPQLRRIFTMCPQIISLNLHQVAPIFAFLLREVSVPSPDLPRVISSRPHLLISDVETRLRPTLYFLQSIGIHQVDTIYM